MSRSAFTIKAFGVYLIVLGAVLIVLPNLLLSAFGFATTTEVWIRVLGVVVLDFGIGYWFAAKADARPFFLATVYGRCFALVAFVAFAALGLVGPMLVLFGVIDFSGAMWTLVALKAERHAG